MLWAREAYLCRSLARVQEEPPCSRLAVSGAAAAVCSPDGGSSVPQPLTVAPLGPVDKKNGLFPHRDKTATNNKKEEVFRSRVVAQTMASGSGDTEGVSWRLIGPSAALSSRRCRLVYSPLGRGSDVCLFYVKGEFFAMDARCAHSGGPLCEGDIEEADGVLQVFCPWHDYDFDLRTGKSGTSLQQQVYEVKLEDDNVYVKHGSRLSLEPFPTEKKS